jgi:hypothetical protein
MTGADVEQLNYDLVALGEYSAGETAPISDTFTSATLFGVEKLQASLGVTQNGTLGLGQAVFVPSAVRVTSVSATLGAAVQPGQPVLSATSTTRQVSIALDASQQSEVKAGDKVTITLPNNQTTPGVISSVGTVAIAPASGSSSTTPTIAVLVNPTDPTATGTWDQAPVNVTIRSTRALLGTPGALIGLGHHDRNGHGLASDSSVGDDPWLCPADGTSGSIVDRRPS